jgi:hypothetical protein
MQNRFLVPRNDNEGGHSLKPMLLLINQYGLNKNCNETTLWAIITISFTSSLIPIKLYYILELPIIYRQDYNSILITEAMIKPSQGDIAVSI